MISPMIIISIILVIEVLFQYSTVVAWWIHRHRILWWPFLSIINSCMYSQVILIPNSGQRSVTVVFEIQDFAKTNGASHHYYHHHHHTMSFISANHVWTKIKQDFFTIFPWGEKKREGRIHMCQHRNYSTYLIYRDALSTTSSKIANANREFPDWGEIAITDDCLRIYSHHIKSSRMTITVVSFISSACKTRLHSYHLVCVYIPLTLVQ